MRCASCGTENPDGARFCIHCASPLAQHRTCASCAADLPEGARFCPVCATPVDGAEAAADPVRDRLRRYIPDELLEKLESARSGQRMAGERRTVTMLFCDLQGSTAAAEDLDPEDWAEIVNSAFEHLIQPVYRYEGTLARLMGDAILAFFGAPIAHEDDPERATRAALEILDGIRPFVDEVRGRWDVELDVRVGIHTGLVVVGEMGSDLRLEYTAMGDAVNLAARMEQTAAPGSIQVSDETHRLIAPLFETEDLGTVEVKGKSEPVQTYRVLGRRSAPGSLRGVAGLESPLVGRDAELTALRDTVDELAAGRGAIVSVMAEAGLGKSRLLAELKLGLERDGHIGPATAATPAPIRWEEGRGQSYTASTPYAPFIDLFTSCFGLAELDTPDAQRDRVHSALGQVLGERTDAIAPYLDVLLGLPVADEHQGLVVGLLPPELRQKVFGAVAELVTALAAERPVALVLEDLHWADSTSIDLLTSLAPIADHSMLLLVALFRPQREDLSWTFHEAASRQHHHRYRALELHPLVETEGRELVANLLRIEGLPEHVRALILRKAEGNPFFVEEVIRSLIDSGAIEPQGATWRATRQIDDVKVPDSLAALITTRLDRLDETTRLVAHTAAIIGREFDRETLAMVLEDVDVAAALGDLERRELIRETARMPRHLYRFRHALTQETAYESALLRTRRDLHRRLAEHVATTAPEQAHDLARHWLGADEPVLAIPHLVSAGTQAFEAYAIPEAIRLLRQATAHLCESCATEHGRKAWEVLAQALTFSGDLPGAHDAAQHLIAFADERGDVASKVAGLNKMAFAQMFGGADDAAFGNLEQACSLAAGVGDDAGLAEANMTYCFLKTNAGMLESALANQQESMRLGSLLGSPVSRAFGLCHYANTLLYLTRYDEAEEAAAEALAFAQASGLKHFAAEVLGHTQPFLRMRDGQFAEALELAEAGRNLAASVGAVNEWATCEYTWGQALMAVGRWDAALRAQEHALELALGAGLGYLATAATSALAVIHHNFGDLATVQRLMEETIERMTMPIGNAMAAACFAETGLCAMLSGDLALAREHFERGIATQSAASYLMEPMLRAGLALVDLQEGNTDAANAGVQQARSIADRKQMVHMGPLTRMAAAQVAMADGDAARGVALLVEGEDLARHIGMLPMAQMLAGAQAQVLAAAGDAAAAEAAAARYRSTTTEIASSFIETDLAATFAAASLAGV